MVKNLRPGRVRWGTAPLCLLLPARPESIEHAHPHAALPEYGEAGVPQSSHPSEARLDGGLRAVGSFAWQGVGRAPRFAEPSPYHFFLTGFTILYRFSNRNDHPKALPWLLSKIEALAQARSPKDGNQL